MAFNSHRSYKTAVNHIRKVEEATGRRLVFPFTVSSTLTYVGYLLKERNVAGATLDKYLSGIRMAHMQRGLFSPWLRPEIVKTIVTGTANKNQIRKRMEGKTGRLPVTPEILKTIKTSLMTSSLPRSKKRMIWLCAAFCWAGAFRIHEILARNTDEFDPTSTLLYGDVKEVNVKVKGEDHKVLRVHIKHPKEERLSAGVIIDLFEVKEVGRWLCPVRAWKDWNADNRIKSCLA